MGYLIWLDPALKQRCYIVNVEALDLCNLELIYLLTLRVLEHDRTIICIGCCIDKLLLHVDDVLEFESSVDHLKLAIWIEEANSIAANAEVGVFIFCKLVIGHVKGL